MPQVKGVIKEIVSCAVLAIFLGCKKIVSSLGPSLPEKQIQYAHFAKTSEGLNPCLTTEFCIVLQRNSGKLAMYEEENILLMIIEN